MLACAVSTPMLDAAALCILQLLAYADLFCVLSDAVSTCLPACPACSSRCWVLGALVLLCCCMRAFGCLRSFSGRYRAGPAHHWAGLSAASLPSSSHRCVCGWSEAGVCMLLLLPGCVLGLLLPLSFACSCVIQVARG